MTRLTFRNVVGTVIQMKKPHDQRKSVSGKKLTEVTGSIRPTSTPVIFHSW